MPLALDVIADRLGHDVVLVAELGGGDVAEASRVTLADGSVVFAKTHRNPPPDFFSTEAAGLAWLAEAGALPVPEVLVCSDDPPLLVLSWIDVSPTARPDDVSFGRSLATLHRVGSECFGRTDGRTTGSRRLPNDPVASWVDFYRDQRLLPLARLAGEADALDPAQVSALEAVANRLEELGGPVEPPARLHGDLWAGNRLVDRDGRSWLIDPATHGGHREFDLSMMRLFGGFGPEAFEAYDDTYPLSDGWQERVPLHQLAPLVVHAIKFGGPYRPAVSQALGALA